MSIQPTAFKNNLQKGDEIQHAATGRRGVVQSQPRETTRFVSVKWADKPAPQPCYVMAARLVVDGKAETVPPCDGDPDVGQVRPDPSKPEPVVDTAMGAEAPDRHVVIEFRMAKSSAEDFEQMLGRLSTPILVGHAIARMFSHLNTNFHLKPENFAPDPDQPKVNKLRVAVVGLFDGGAAVLASNRATFDRLEIEDVSHGGTFKDCDHSFVMDGSISAAHARNICARVGKDRVTILDGGVEKLLAALELLNRKL